MRTTKYEYQSDFARKYFARGREEGREEAQARAWLLVLKSRQIAVPDEAVRYIEAERDSEQLEEWIRRAATAATIDDVLGDRGDERP